MSSKKAGRRVVCRRAATVLAGAVGAVSVALSPSAAGSDYVGGAGVGNWSVATNWSPVGVPTAGASVNFLNADGLNRTLNYDYAGPAVTLGQFYIDQTGTGTNTVEMPAGLTLSTYNTFVGAFGSAVFNQRGGTHTMTQGLTLGYDPKSRGTYTLSGDDSVLTTSNSSDLIGFGGVGVFEQSGGRHTTPNMFVGFQGGNGTYRLSGSGRLDVTSFESIGDPVASAGYEPTAVFEQSGGTHTAYGIVMGTAAGKTVTYRLSGGTLAVSVYETVGQATTFEQSGGTHTMSGSLGISGRPSAPATYSLSGGVLYVKGLTVGGSNSTSVFPGTLSVGGSGTATVSGSMGIATAGTVNVTGGSLAASGTNDGTLNLSGGSISGAWTTSKTGTFSATGGTFSGSLGNSGIVRVGGQAALTITGSVVGDFGGTAVGRLILEGGGSVVADSVYQGSVEMSGSGANPAPPGPLLSIRRTADGGKTSVVRSLTITSGTDGRPAGRVDLADTALVIDYIFAGQSPIADVRRLIGAAWAGGTWTGNGLGSSVAAATAGRALGYGEASAVLGPDRRFFAGQTVDGTAVLVKYTVMGDATLNGTVNFDDLLALAKHYNGTNATWWDGDFNYDAVVNFDDLLILAKNYNGTLAGPVPGAPAGFDADVAAAFAEAAVPEPGTIGGLVVAAVALVRGRRRVRRER